MGCRAVVANRRSTYATRAVVCNVGCKGCRLVHAMVSYGNEGGAESEWFGVNCSQQYWWIDSSQSQAKEKPHSYDALLSFAWEWHLFTRCTLIGNLSSRAKKGTTQRGRRAYGLYFGLRSVFRPLCLDERAEAVT